MLYRRPAATHRLCQHHPKAQPQTRASKRSVWPCAPVYSVDASYETSPGAPTLSHESSAPPVETTLFSLLRRAWMTWAIAALLAVAFAATRSVTGQVVIRFAALQGGALERGEWWRLVTSLLVHDGWTHLLSDVGSLLVLGALVEASLGSIRCGTLFVVSGVVGWLLSFASGALGGELALGSSGAVMGLLGSATVLATRADRAPFSRGWLAGWAVLIFLSGAFLPIDGVAHFGGWLCGLLYALFLRWNA